MTAYVLRFTFYASRPFDRLANYCFELFRRGLARVAQVDFMVLAVGRVTVLRFYILIKLSYLSNTKAINARYNPLCGDLALAHPHHDTP